MKRISLVTPLRNESELLERGLQELDSFIQKFPLEWELVLVVDPSKDATLKKAKALRSEKVEVQVIGNTKLLGRGQSVREGLLRATGDLIMIFPLDFTVPLGDLLQLIQEMIQNPNADLVIGNRNTSRKKRVASGRTRWHWVLENILMEKFRAIPFQDPISPYFIFRRPGLTQVLPDLRLKSWYYTPEILLRSHAKGLKIVEVPIHSRDRRASRIPLFREYLRNLL